MKSNKKGKTNKYNFLINKYCKEPLLIWKDRSKIKQQVHIAKKLYLINPDKDFWEKLYLPFKLNSLAWFLTSAGKNFLIIEKQKVNLSFGKREIFPLQKKRVGKDKKIITKPRTIFDFLNEEKKKRE
tara:strand:+ start:352 stop:732 length:381 start_codon:yes stop_codon:yes gene_type:complete